MKHIINFRKDQSSLEFKLKLMAVIKNVTPNKPFEIEEDLMNGEWTVKGLSDNEFNLVYQHFQDFPNN